MPSCGRSAERTIAIDALPATALPSKAEFTTASLPSTRAAWTRCSVSASPDHLRAAQRIVLACAIRYRLPEPTRLADQLGAAKRAIG